MKLKYILIILLYCSCSISIWGQEPSFQVNGAAFFEETDIYSLLEDEAKNMWITTDHGLFRYDGYEFVKFVNKDQKSNSLFELTTDNNGELYCINLEGQIFKIEEDSLHVYYQVPDSLLGSLLYINFDNKNQLVISSKRFFILNPNKTIRILDQGIEGIRTLIPKPTKNKDGALVIYFLDEEVLVYFKDDKLTIKELICAPKPLKSIDYRILANQSHEIGLDINRSKFVRNEKDIWVDIKINLTVKNSSCTLSKKNQIWVFGKKKGAYVFDMNGKPLFGGKAILSDYLISSFLEDKEGNIWLGTFKGGLLFIPNLNVLDYTNHFLLNKEDFSCLTQGASKEIYLGSQTGRIFYIDTTLELNLVTDTYTQPVSRMLFLEDREHLLFNNTWIKIKNKVLPQATEIKCEMRSSTIKYIQRINRNELLIADPYGIFYVNIEGNENSSLNVIKSIFDQGMMGGVSRLMLGRTQCLYFQGENLWLGLASGLQLLTEETKVDLTYKNKEILATSIVGDGTHVYVGTQDGLLIYKEAQLQERISKEEGLLSNKINKIKYEDDFLFIAHSQGIQRLDLKKRTYLNFEKSDGLLSNSILDFVVNKGVVWLLTKKGLQIFRFDELSQPQTKPIWSFLDIKVNENEVDAGLLGDFKFDENKIEFEFIAKSHRDKYELRYFYKLEGGNEVWEQTNYPNNKVRYNALSPGAYTFLVKAIDTKGQESTIITYSFSIALPYWRQWWFILFGVLGIVTIVSGVFALRINIIKKENSLLLEKQEIEKELIESRKVALRSQMNPHFLFNALNSIQEMIIVNDKQLASQYLGKFANLMRIYLNHSQKNRIKLKEEIEALKLYFDLEKIRFEDTLVVSLEIDEALDLDLIKLPSMLVQIYVENAFKHGLLHKKTNRQLNVTFSKDSLNDALLCMIEDNGIGREASAKFNQLKRLKHASFSTSATQKRLELLNYKQRRAIEVEIIDLKDAAHVALGTRVILTIPFVRF